MAIWDRLRGRRRQQPEEESQERFLGWRPQEETRQPVPKLNVPAAEDPEGEELGRLSGPQTAEEQDAYRRGREMGIQALFDMAGITEARRQQMDMENRKMNRLRLAEATVTLMEYRTKKASINKRVIAAQEWWKLNNWQQIELKRGVKGINQNKSNTGWLWNCIVGKHADAMDSFPEPVFLPRAEDDREEAKRLSKIIPVEMDINDFEQTYNDIKWQQMIEGTGVYGVFWNPRKLNGLGDVEIKKVNMLNLYWEPGITDIQESRNVFYISWEDKDLLLQQYPELEGQLTSGQIPVDQYRIEDGTNLYQKAAVVDWYYKVQGENGKDILHYCKYVNEICLYSSEEKAPDVGFYDDGQYPFVLDALYPIVGSPAGYGYVDIAADTQADIDQLNQAMVLNAVMRATPRYFARKDGGVNEKEFMDITKPIIHVNGNLGQDSVRAWEVQQMGSDAHQMLAQKIDELKFITGNTDVNNGGVPSGVTAASAIAALKEDSGRSSKDMNKAGYRAFKKVVALVKSRVTQFMDIPRQFRIIGSDGSEEFTMYSNARLKPQVIPNLPGQAPGMRVPEFDIEIRAQRENAYTKMSQNELALQFWGNGMLNPQMTDQALMVLDMMDFRDKDKLVRAIKKQGTLIDVLQKIVPIAMELAARTDPAIAMQLQQVLGAVSADTGEALAMPAGGGMTGGGALAKSTDALDAPPNPVENRIVARAKERAANASRPN